MPSSEVAAALRAPRHVAYTSFRGGRDSAEGMQEASLTLSRRSKSRSLLATWCDATVVVVSPRSASQSPVGLGRGADPNHRCRDTRSIRHP